MADVLDRIVARKCGEIADRLGGSITAAEPTTRSLRAALARPVVELGDRDLLGLDEHGGSSLRPVGDVVALGSARSAHDDETGVTCDGIERGQLVERSCRATDVVAEARARSVENEEPGRPIARHLERMRDLAWDEHPGLGTDRMRAILELERELPLEDVQRLGVPGMDVRRRISPAGRGAHGHRGELLDVREERHIELRAAEDDLAFADLDHRPAA